VLAMLFKLSSAKKDAGKKENCKIYLQELARFLPNDIKSLDLLTNKRLISTNSKEMSMISKRKTKRL
jgi:glutamate dehydrogenase/leucine dehydrogenase